MAAFGDSLLYHAEVLYEHVVDGQLQSSHDISFGDYVSSEPLHAKGVVNKHPAGTVVTVHYSPSNPTKAVLETGINGHACFWRDLLWFTSGDVHLRPSVPIATE